MDNSLINIEGLGNLTVPTLAVWAKSTDLPAKLDSMIQEELSLVETNLQVLLTSSAIRKIEKLKRGVWMNAILQFDDKFFERYMLWLGSLG